MSPLTASSRWTLLRRWLTDRLLEGLVPPLLWALERMPFELRGRLLSLGGRWLSWPSRLNPLRNTLARASSQVEVALKLTRAQSHALVCEMMRRLAWMSCVLLEPVAARKERAQASPVQGLRHLLKPLQAGKGVILLTGHLGNWELMGGTLAHHLGRSGFQLEVVAKALRQPVLQRLLAARRHDLDIGLILRGSQASLEQLQARLQEPRVVAMLVDHDTRAPGMMVPFLDRLAHTVSGPIVLAAATGLPVVMVYSEWMSEGQWQVRLEPLVLPPLPSRCHVDHAPSLGPWLQEALRAMNEQLGAAIRRQPADWTWMHARWRSHSRGWLPSEGFRQPSQPPLPEALPETSEPN